MRNNLIKKSLVLFVIFLFFGISIIPTTNCNTVEIRNFLNLKDYENTDLNQIKKIEKTQFWKYTCNNSSIDTDENYNFITDGEYSFVIIANELFYDYDGTWDLQELADWHNNNDTISAYVVNLSEIYLNSTFWVNGAWGDGTPSNPFNRSDEDGITNYDMFNDSQAKIRNYLRYAYTNLSVRYALLVGDADDSNPLFPIRECYSRGDGAPLITGAKSPQYELIPTDMYYACLDGTFNADEDVNSEGGHSGFGENATECTENIDECDWEYDIAVGRFPVDDTTELSHIVQKTISYMNLNGDEEYLQNITLAGQGGGFGGITQWMCNYSKTLNGSIYNSWKDKDTTHGFDSDNWRIKIIDANPNREEGEPFYDENSRGDFNNGVHIFYESSHGNIYGWAASGGEGESFTTSDIQALTNLNYCFVISAMPCNTATFDESSDPFGEQFVTDENGAFAYLGNTRYGYGSYASDGLNSSSHRLGAEILDALLNNSEGYERIGDMIWDSKKDVRHWHDDLGDEAIRYAMYEQILFGSPAVMVHCINDSTPPKISNIQAIPSVQNSGDYVNISAKVIDNINVDEVFLNIEYPDSNVKFATDNYSCLEKIPIMNGYTENFSIAQNKTGNIYYCNKTYSQVGVYTYNIWANDTNGNQNVSADYYFEIIQNQAPYNPSDPDPPDGATDIDINADLSWSCSDPDGDDLTYDVYFEADDTTPDVLVSNNQSESWYDPGTMEYDTHFYWQIVAWDEYGLSTSGPVWDFTTGSEPNNPPYPPSNPSPEDGAINVDIEVVLSWDCDDPDGDSLSYDVYFDTVDPPVDKVSDDQIDTTFDLGILMVETTYYWYIIAKDEHGASNSGLVWHFTTRDNYPPDAPIIEGPNRGKPETSYEYGFTSVDSEEHDIAEYIVDWGDGTGEVRIIGPFASGDEAKANHTWDDKGTYTIQAKAKDIFGDESNLSEFEVEIPRTKTAVYSLFLWFLERFPLLERLLTLIKICLR